MHTFYMNRLTMMMKVRNTLSEEREIHYFCPKIKGYSTLYSVSKIISDPLYDDFDIDLRTKFCEHCISLVCTDEEVEKSLYQDRNHWHENIKCPCYILGTKEAERRAFSAIKKWKHEILFRKF